MELEADPEAVASVLFALADGIGIQVASEPDWNSGPTFEVGIGVARRLLGA